MKKIASCLLFLLTLNVTHAQWQRTVGPYHANVVAFGQNTTTLFALGEQQGVFRSTDNGASWSEANPSMLPQWTAFNALTVVGDTVYVGTGKSFFVSTDNGDNWTERNNGLPQDIRVYVCLVNGTDLLIGTNEGVFRSSDQGNNWTTANTGIPADKAVRGLVKQGDNLYAGTTEGMFRSTDNGNSWIEKNNGITTSTFIYSLAADASNLYAGTTDGVLHSTDQGDNWTLKDEGLFFSFGMYVFTNNNKAYAGTNTGLYVYSNQGDTWEVIKDGDSIHLYTNSSTRALLFNGSDLWAGGSEGIALSTNGGADWTIRNAGLPFVGVYSMATNGDKVYAGTGRGLYITEDLGETWVRKFNQFVSSIEARDSNIYIAGAGRVVHVSSNYGETWTRATGFGDNGQEVFAVAGETVFAKYNASLFSEGQGYISTDNGAFFTQEDLPYSIFANRDVNTVFALDSQVVQYKSGSWVSVSGPIGSDTAYCLGVTNNRLLVGIKGGILSTTYSGTDWNKITFGTPEARVTRLEVKGANVYACNDHNQIFSSDDHGNHWTEFTDAFADSIIPLQQYGIKSRQIVPNNTHLFVAGKEGVWRRPLTEIVGLEEPVWSHQVAIYPNPTQGEVTISGPELTEIVVRDLLGREVMRITKPQPTHLLTLQDQTKGVYFVTLSKEGQHVTRKLIIQ